MAFTRYFFALAISTGALTACGSDSASPAPSPTGSSTSSDQLPPTSGGTDLEAWLAQASYKDWHCETATHPQMKVSPHGVNRVCSNDLIANFTGAVGDERPKDSAAVKELYDDSMTIVGYAVEVKVAATSESGKNWYWYERVPLDSMVPHDAKGVVADGIGLMPETQTALKGLCIGCHGGAGSDSDMHLINKSGDFVYDVVN